MSPLFITLILSAVSGLLLALGCFVRPLIKICGILCFLWLIAALPVMFFLNIGWSYVLLFYLISGTMGLSFLFGGKPK